MKQVMSALTLVVLLSATDEGSASEHVQCQAHSFVREFLQHDEPRLLRSEGDKQWVVVHSAKASGRDGIRRYSDTQYKPLPLTPSEYAKPEIPERGEQE